MNENLLWLVPALTLTLIIIKLQFDFGISKFVMALTLMSFTGFSCFLFAFYENEYVSLINLVLITLQYFVKAFLVMTLCYFIAFSVYWFFKDRETLINWFKGKY